MKILFLPLLLASAAGPFLFPGREAEPAAAAAVQDPLAPGPQHAQLQELVGTWDAVTITTDEQGAEQRTKGTLVRVKHTDYHTLDSYEGEFMGMKFLGHGVNGYCPVKKQYYTLWTDSMTPTPMIVYGDYDAGKRELSLSGECYGMSGKLEPCRTVTRYRDGDHYTFQFLGAGPDGKEMAHFTIEYTRRK